MNNTAGKLNVWFSKACVFLEITSRNVPIPYLKVYPEGFYFFKSTMSVVNYVFLDTGIAYVNF